MLAARLGPARVEAEPEAVDEIIGNCYGLPLALAVVAARAAERPTFSLASLSRQLTRADNVLDRFADAATGLDPRATFSWSYDSLAPHAQRLFRRLGRTAAPELPLEAIASLADLDDAQLWTALDELVAAHLLTEHRPGWFELPDLLRAYAAELAAIERVDD